MPAIEFSPAQIVHGGTAVVYLNQSATAATATFLGRQYPMLRTSERWWAIIGVGALQTANLYPVSITYTPAGSAAPVSLVASIAVTKRDFPVEHVTLDPTAAALLAPDIIQAELAQRASIYSGYTTQRFWSGPFLPPSPNAYSSEYGEGRSYNGAPVTDYHRGNDFVGEIGSPVSAAAAGRVVFTGELRVRGNSVIIDHGAGVFTAYHHLSRINVRQGDMVNAGASLGLMGSTGLVTGPHLHWEVVVRGVEVDGKLWLQNREIGP